MGDNGQISQDYGRKAGDTQTVGGNTEKQPDQSGDWTQEQSIAYTVNVDWSYVKQVSSLDSYVSRGGLTKY